nr:hypothetical protein [Tanacetum cinerariifolium]
EERHFAKDCEKAKVKYYNYYKTKMLLAKKDSDEQVLLAEDQAWMESSSDSDNEINANMKRIEKANQQRKDLENQNKDLQEKYDVLINQVNTFKEQNNEFNEQIKVLNEKNSDLLAQTKVLQDQLKVKHVVIDTYTECQAQYEKLEEERYKYMIRYSAIYDNDKQHRKKIDEQEILFNKMSRQLVEMNNNVLRLQEKISEKETKISELEGYKMSRDVITVGSTMWILLLYRGEYTQWHERFMNYLEEQTDGKEMINSIRNGDQPLPVIAQVSLAGTAQNAPPTLKDPKFWTAEEKNTQKIDHLARCLLIQGLPNDIYSLIDSNETAKDLWDALERQMCGFEYGEQDRKAAILYEYETFKAIKGEQLLDTYLRYLQQNQGDVNDALGYKKKAVVVTSDPLALVAEKMKVSKQKEKVVVSSDSKGSGADDFSELKKITA